MQKQNEFRPQMQCLFSIMHADSCKRCDKCINQAKAFVKEFSRVPIALLDNHKIDCMVRGYAILQDAWGIRRLQKWIDGFDPKGKEVNSTHSYWGYDE